MIIPCFDIQGYMQKCQNHVIILKIWSLFCHSLQKVDHSAFLFQFQIEKIPFLCIMI